MNTKGALSSDSLLSLNGTGASGLQSNNAAAPMGTQQGGFAQAPNTQQSFNQPMNTQPPMQQNYNQPMNTQPPVQQAAVPRQRPQGGGVQLKKGQKMSLSQISPNLSEIQVCLGWDLINQACDLDASAFMLGADGKVVGDDWFVFYGQPTSPDGSIVHYGDSTDGAGAGDDCQPRQAQRQESVHSFQDGGRQ